MVKKITYIMLDITKVAGEITIGLFVTNDKTITNYGRDATKLECQS